MLIKRCDLGFFQYKNQLPATLHMNTHTPNGNWQRTTSVNIYTFLHEKSDSFFDIRLDCCTLVSVWLLWSWASSSCCHTKLHLCKYSTLWQYKSSCFKAVKRGFVPLSSRNVVFEDKPKSPPMPSAPLAVRAGCSTFIYESGKAASYFSLISQHLNCRCT